MLTKGERNRTAPSKQAPLNAPAFTGLMDGLRSASPQPGLYTWETGGRALLPMCGKKPVFPRRENCVGDRTANVVRLWSETQRSSARKIRVVALWSGEPQNSAGEEVFYSRAAGNRISRNFGIRGNSRGRDVFLRVSKAPDHNALWSRRLLGLRPDGQLI
jgi:hypothetical protein